MRKNAIKVIILVLMLPFSVRALGANGVVGGFSYKAPTSSFGNCSDNMTLHGMNPYFCDSQKKGSPSLEIEGLRITFYNLNGKQLGNSIDVWTKTQLQFGQFTNFKTDCVSLGRFKKCTTNNVTFIAGSPSRIDYYSGTVAANNNISPIMGGYTYYVDTAYDGKTTYNPLWYTAPDCLPQTKYENSMFKSYFMSPEIVLEYLKIAGVAEINPYETSEYYFILEPVFSVRGCEGSTGLYSSVLTNADFHYFVKRINMPRSGNFILNCAGPQYVTLEKNASIKVEMKDQSGKTIVEEVTFEKPEKLKDNCYPAWEDMTTRAKGYGMYLVYGNQICKKCGGDISAVVYHTINLDKPFLSLDGGTRTLDPESNWYQKESTIDTNIYKKTPKYTVVLTPTIIKQIRAENKTIKYSELSAETFEKFKITYAGIFR